MQKLKENLPIIIGLGIPVVMVLVIAGVIYGQQTFSSIPAPTQNFVYAVGGSVAGVSPYGYPVATPSDPCSEVYYRVASGTLKQYPIDPKSKNDPYCKDRDVVKEEPMFYRHNVGENKSTRLTFEEVAKLHLDNTPKSKDGYEYTSYVDRGDAGIFGLFGGGRSDYNARYLKNEQRYEKMNLQIPSEGYYGADTFLGWVAE